MSEKFLSIIIPTYNMELYLKRCLDSLVSAIEILDNIEIVVVNDGSKDKSLLIANSYKDKYPDSVVVIDKQNGNYGSCINAALKVISGKYVKVLDADDWFNTQAFTKFVKCIESLDVDLVLTDYTKRFENDGKKLKVTYPFVEDKIYTSEIMKNSNFQNMQMHSVTYRTSILKRSSYLQTEGISYTDQEWILYPMKYVENIVYLKVDLYQYLLGREGQTMDSKVLYKNIKHHMMIAERMVGDSVSWYNNSKQSPQYVYCKARMLFYIRSIYKMVLLYSDGVQNLKYLSDFDNYISTRNTNFYADLLLSTIHNTFYPFHFIGYYHKKHKKLPFVAKLINKCMKLVQPV